MNTHLYRKISIIKFNNKRFQVFRDELGRYAFLELDDNNKFHYPKVEDFIELANMFSRDLHNEAMFKKGKRNKANRLKFTASVLAATSVIACSTILFNQLQADKQFDNNNVTEYISVSDDYQHEVVFEDISAPTVIEDISEPTEIKEEESEDVNFVPNSSDDPDKQESIDTSRSTQITDDMYYVHDNGIEVDIYNSAALNKFLGYKDVTIDDIIEVVNNNPGIDSKMKPIIIDFARDIMKTYPNVDMRVFYENMKVVKVVYETDESIAQHGRSLAWFDWASQEIHINENSDLTEGSYAIMIVRHELCHVLMLLRLNTDDHLIIRCVQKDGNYGEFIQECTAVLISAYPFEDRYEFTDLGYGIVSNEFRAIVEAIPNVDYSVIVNQDVHGIEDYLDEKIDSDIPPERLFDLMELQTNVYYNFKYVKVDNEDFKAIYQYIADAYTQNVLKPNMSYEEIMQIQNNLIDRLNKDVDYTEGLQYTDVIEDEFNEYITMHNIQSNNLSK